ncbi:conserved hypothetical protein [Leishmania major strain Friedlin]|uniref:Uncharacterized protein n=1 Tax=Leishmania major TaxID=5664 RepID=Q4QA97_LEIMA|nr:conserved hypothetical protein [Leishmania major strain Friedlin]CAG9574753.1 hypothetical_protein_-_conserved [Leishmania major strain Friedlin]CAJ05429.1 conserved hypothetical protein [Leishmania major strain Friedlin]|eukprot:XP_001683751.1 conserved hypothetical protein [Leishmania major strain Friedlin]
MEVEGTKERARGVTTFTRADLELREAAEDHRALLAEPWASHALRKGYSGREEHTKWITETWEAFERRKEDQKLYLERHDLCLQYKAAQLSETRRLSEQKSAALVEKMMALEAARKGALLQSRHFLFVDYYDYQQFLFRNQRSFVEDEEKLLRCKLSETEDDLMCLLVIQWHLSSHLHAAREKERVEEEAAAERLREFQYRQKLEEERLREEQRIAQEKEASQAEKEQAELEKRLERKRRDAERRAKVRAEREQRRAQE